MKRVSQTKFGRPEGNCFEACLASLLELPLSEVPQFKHGDWLDRINKWLRYNFSLQLVVAPPDVLLAGVHPSTYVIANGPNSDGVMHSVVCKGNTLVHDPNPNNKGIQEVSSVLIFVALNPARMRRSGVR